MAAIRAVAGTSRQRGDRADLGQPGDDKIRRGAAAGDEMDRPRAVLQYLTLQGGPQPGEARVRVEAAAAGAEQRKGERGQGGGELVAFGPGGGEHVADAARDRGGLDVVVV